MQNFFADTIEARVAGYDWVRLKSELDSYGCTVLEDLLTTDECAQLARLYSHPDLFRPL